MEPPCLSLQMDSPSQAASGSQTTLEGSPKPTTLQSGLCHGDFLVGRHSELQSISYRVLSVITLKNDWYKAVPKGNASGERKALSKLE